MFFKDRAITVTVDKKTVDQIPEPPKDPQELEKKADFVLTKLETLGTKVFVGICIYVILDTRRQVAVARASRPES